MSNESISKEQDLTQHDDVIFVSQREVCKARNRGDTSQDNDVKQGTWTKPVKMGGKLKHWPNYEVDIQIAASIAGLSIQEKKELVVSLHDARTKHFESLIKQYAISALGWDGNEVST